MPPQSKITKEHLLSSAAALIREQGSQALNARSLAKRTGCSTQPIFSKFESMEDLIGQVREREFAEFQEYFRSKMQSESNPLVGAGVGLMTYAEKNPGMFSFLFLEHTGEDVEQLPASYLKTALFSKEIVTWLKSDSGLDESYVKLVLGHFYPYLYGRAVTMVTLQEKYTEEKVRQEFKDFYKAYRKMYKKKDKE